MSSRSAVLDLMSRQTDAEKICRKEEQMNDKPPPMMLDIVLFALSSQDVLGVIDDDVYLRASFLEIEIR